MADYAPPSVLPVADLHLANRFTFGVDTDVAAQIRAAGGGPAWFAQQLDPTGVPDPTGQAAIGAFPRLTDSPQAAWNRIRLGTHSRWDYGQDMVGFTLARRILSARQVHEVMTDFWTNLLYVPAYEDRSIPWRFSYDTAVRAHALGTFRDLLQATIVHPAMSGWLSNDENRKGGINENLGRELLELHTVGRVAGYSEDDVLDSARILTGFAVDVHGTFAASYQPADHHTGPVQVLGFSHDNAAADGRPVVDAYLSYLASHPATAQRIARRLCVRFVSDDPPSSIVDAVRDAYLAHDTDIGQTLLALVGHPEFAASAGAKVRTPTEDLVATVRVSGVVPTGASASNAFIWHLAAMTYAMGNRPFSWPRPDGYPETSATWSSPARLLSSWQLHHALPANTAGSTQATFPAKASVLPTVWPRTVAEIVEHQSRVLIGAPSDPDMLAAVTTLLGVSATALVYSAGQVSQDQFVKLRGTILNSPRMLVR